MQSRASNLRQLLSTYQSQVPLSERSRVSAALSVMEEKLERLQEALAADNLDIEALRDLSDDIKVSLSNISDEELRRLFEEMSSIKARIEEASQSGSTNGSTYQSRLQYESQRLQKIREYLRRLYEASKAGTSSKRLGSAP
jgi:predicted  nucleic acid-binding Zn-ribbon protein